MKPCGTLRRVLMITSTLEITMKRLKLKRARKITVIITTKRILMMRKTKKQFTTIERTRKSPRVVTRSTIQKNGIQKNLPLSTNFRKRLKTRFIHHLLLRLR